MELKPFAKGKRGLVSLARYRGKTIVVKIKNPNATIDRLANEAEMLRKVNRKGISPRFYFFKEGKLGMEYLKGMAFESYVRKEGKKRIQDSIRDLLKQMHTLDTLGIVKEEMHHPVKHILMKGHRPVLIDFERSHFSEKPHNVPQFLQYLSSGRMAPVFASKGLVFGRKTCIRAAKRYARKRDFSQILRGLGLVWPHFSDRHNKTPTL